jgi:nucleotide-binding universal stress UspA family protein
VVPQSGPLPFNVDRKRVRGEIASELRQEHQFLQRLAQCLRDREIDASALLTEGATTDTILEESQRLDADLVVVGSHGHGLLYRALLDGTGERLLGESACPIMFVPEHRP